MIASAFGIPEVLSKGWARELKIRKTFLQPLDTCAQPFFLFPHFNRKGVNKYQGNAIAATIQAKNPSLLSPGDR